MDIETIRNICIALPAVTEDIKWGNDLCFMVGGKMFCVAILDTTLKVSIKVTEEEFQEMINSDGIIPAPYAARNKWILVEKPGIFNSKKWEYYITRSYHLVKSKLSKKKQSQLN
jgi:predicted DNA-binding protein (MmcQ/YjbR family)